MGSEQRQTSPPSALVADGYGDSEVARFYQDRAVFLTGGTGFIGKVLVEKLLRSCPGVKRVYLLIRTKRGEEPQSRLATILGSQVFDRLKREQPDALEKVSAFSGDIALPSLGLSESDKSTLVKEVSVVFHSAATIKFDEPLKLAVQLNVLGTRSVLDLCKQISNLCAFVHVSTAYSNCEKATELHEVIYQPCVDTETVIKAAQSTDNSVNSEEEFLCGLPNTYTLTKRLAESLLRDEHGTVPLAIVRPSIVTASWKEPFPGWIDNYAACTGVIAWVGTGLLPSMMAKKDCLADIVPVDMVVNVLICAAWHTAIARPQQVRVYHCCSSDVKSQTWDDMTNAVQEAVLRHPLPFIASYPKFTVTNSVLRYHVNLWCRHYLPAFIADLYLQLTGQKPRFIRRYHKVRRSMDIAQYFTTHGWLFRSNNTVGLISDLSPKDKELFDFSLQNMEWQRYYDQYIIGIGKYLLKAEDGKQSDARRRLKWFYALHLSLPFFLLILVSRLLMTKKSRELGQSTTTTFTRVCETLLAP